MNLLTLVLLGMAIAAPIALCWIVLIEIPELAHTQYRHTLWEIHDELLEAVATGRVQRSSTALGLLDDLDGLIRTSDNQTLLRLLIAMRTFGGEAPTGRDNPISSDSALLESGIAPRDRNELLQYTRRIRRAINVHLKRGSVVGWIVALVVRFMDARERQRRVVEIYSTEVAVSRSSNPSARADLTDGPHLRPRLLT